MTNTNKLLTFVTIIFFFFLLRAAFTLSVSHQVVEEGTTIHTNVFGGVVEVTTDTLSTPDYSSEEAWEDSLRKTGYYEYEGQ